MIDPTDEEESVLLQQAQTKIPKDYMSIPMLVEDPICPLSEKAVRFHVWRSGVNGLAPAIFRIGKKILIKRSEWIRWLESHGQQKKGKNRG